MLHFSKLGTMQKQTPDYDRQSARSSADLHDYCCYSRAASVQAALACGRCERQKRSREEPRLLSCSCLIECEKELLQQTWYMKKGSKQAI